MSKHPGSLAAKLLLLSAPLWLLACSGSSAPGIATLDALTLSAGTLNPVFDSAVTGYSAIVPAGTLSVTVTPTATSASASITLAQDSGAPATVASGSPSAPLTVPARGAQSIISIAVTAPGETARTYTVQLVQADSADASLAGLSLSAGTLSPAFSSGTFTYTAAVPAGTTSLKLTPTATYPNVKTISIQQDSATASTVTSGNASASLLVPALGATSKITITVTAQNGYTTQAYVLSLMQVASNDASLMSLAASAGTLTPAFASGTLSYALVVPPGTSSLTLTPAATSSAAKSIALTQDGTAKTVTNGGASAALTIPAVGTTSRLVLTVTAQDGTTTAVYSIALTQQASSDATLSSLAVSAGSLSPAFAAGTLTYSLTVSHGTSSLTVTPTATSAVAKSITIAQDGGAGAVVASGHASPALTVPAVGATSTVTIAVVPQDSSATRTYTLTLTQAASTDSSLSNLTVSAGTLHPTFASGVTTYTATLPSATTSLTITPTANDASAKSITISQDGGAPVAIASGSASGTINVPPTGSSTVISLVVTAQSGATTTYQLTLSRAAANDATLAGLTTTAGPLTPAFSPATASYSVAALFTATTITVTPSANSPTAKSITVSVNGGAPATVASGSASAPISVPAAGATTTIAFKVTAEDNATTQTYSIALTRQPADTNAALANLAPSTGSLSPAFAAANASYTLAVPFGTTAATLTPTAAASDIQSITVAQDSGAAQPVASGSPSQALTVPAFGATSTIHLVVTAQDGTTTRAYTVALTQAGRTDSALSALTDSTGALTGFSPTTLSYSYSVPYQTGAHTITATTHDSLATVKVNGTTATSGTPATVPLTVGSNTVNVVVTSADGTATTTYVLTINEAAAPAGLPGLVNARTVPVTAGALRKVAKGALLPANAAANIPIDTLLRIGFDGAPTIGTAGSIKIFTAGGALVDTITLGDQPALYNGSTKLLTHYSSSMVNVIGGLTSGIDQVRIVNYTPIQISGNTAVIIPHNNKLIYATSYYVTIDNGVLTGAINGTNFTGITATSGAGSWTFSTKASAPGTYNVADDDSADFATVQGAIDQVPVANSAAITISIAPGVYPEMLFDRSKKNLTLQGTNNGVGTIIQADNCDGFNPGTGGGYTLTTKGAGATLPADNGTNGIAGGGRPIFVFSSATGIVFDSITFNNTHPQGSAVIQTVPPQTITASTSPTFTSYTSSITQAETIYFNTTFSFSAGAGAAGTLIARHSNFISYQDTIQVKGYTWFYDCFITGDTDFIWGNANVALFERSEIKSRYNANSASIVQSRAYLTGGGSTSTPASYNASDLGFVFLNCALTKEDGTFSSYLARSPGAPTTSGSSPSILYLQYDIVSFINCSMDSQIPPAGWNVVGGNPTGANVVPSPVTGWREYGSVMPDGVTPIDVSQRVGPSASPYGSIQLTSGNVSTFFPNRNAILQGGATDGTYTSQGLAGFAPAP